MKRCVGMILLPVSMMLGQFRFRRAKNRLFVTRYLIQFDSGFSPSMLPA